MLENFVSFHVIVKLFLFNLLVTQQVLFRRVSVTVTLKHCFIVQRSNTLFTSLGFREFLCDC